MIAYLFRCLFFLMILFTGLLYTLEFSLNGPIICPALLQPPLSAYWYPLSGQHCLAAARSHCSCICCIKPQAFWGNF